MAKIDIILLQLLLANSRRALPVEMNLNSSEPIFTEKLRVIET